MNIGVIIEGRVFLQPLFRDCPPEAFVLKIKDFGHSDLFRISDLVLRISSGGDLSHQSCPQHSGFAQTPDYSPCACVPSDAIWLCVSADTHDTA